MHVATNIFADWSWADLITGERLATILVALAVIIGLLPNLIRFIGQSLHGLPSSNSDRLTFGICCISLAASMYAFFNSVRVLHLWEYSSNAMPITAGALMLLGFYQIFVAMRAARRGHINGFIWEYGLAVLIITTIGTYISHLLQLHAL